MLREVLNIAKFQSMLFLLIGLICGIIYSFGGLLVDTLVSWGLSSGEYWSTPGLSYGTILAFGALIGMPLIFGIGGFALGLVEGLLYALIGKRIKWMQIEKNFY